MSTEPNGTMVTFTNITGIPNIRCIDWGSWLFTYQPPYLWFTFILGFIENLFVISVFVLHKSGCTVTEIYLGNVAASDLIYVSSLPFKAVYYSRNHWPFGSFMCSAVFFTFPLNFYSSIYCLMMVSIDRYLALVKPMSISRLRRPWWAKVTCGIIWVFAVGLSLPDGVFRNLVTNEKLNTTKCVNHRRSKNNWYITTNIIMNVLGFLLPLVIITFCTSQMIRVLRNKAMQQCKKVNKERKATWLVLSVFLAFMVCWIPYNVSIFIFTLSDFNVYLPCLVESLNTVVRPIAVYLVFSNSCINPLLYCMVGNSFRQKAREVYSRLLCKVPDRSRS